MMFKITKAAVALLFLKCSGSVDAFVTSSTNPIFQSRNRAIITQNALPTPEESAEALTAYMAKSHEAKLKAVKDVEDKKNAEIEALKKQLQEAQQNKSESTSLTIPNNASAGSVDDLAAKLLSYQQFMTKYIVKAQEDKYKAVKAAEEAIAKKYESKLNAYLLNSSPSAVAPNTTQQNTLLDSNPGSKLYQGRNLKVASSGKTGKSRWGDAEVNKAVISSMDTVTSVSQDLITAADHGIRRATGPSLADRVNMGSTTSPSTPVLTSNKGSIITKVNPTPVLNADNLGSKMYQNRNVKVAAAGKSGKSRWGDPEIQRAVSSAANSNLASVSEEIITAADHGIRKVGPTLSDRVNLGSSLLKTLSGTGPAVPSVKAPPEIIVTSSSSPSIKTILFDKRNSKIAAASKAGKQSRWGGLEESKAVQHASIALPASPTVPEGSGLRRPDTPSLAQRINFGAQLLN